MSRPDSKVNSTSFYSEFHGHRISHLEKLYSPLRESADSLIWTAGDSSLDNKYWFGDRRDAVGAYAQVLDPPISICDVTFWLNYLSLQRYDPSSEGTRGGPKYAAINTAVEATTLNSRCYNLQPQDEFLRDNISKDDILIVSIGGNDVALAPSPCTIATMVGMTHCLPQKAIEKGFTCCSIPVDDYCSGCSTSLVSCGGACPPCLGYLRHLFGTRIEKYIEKITAKTIPKKILVCMIYYLDENKSPSWANVALGALGYNKKPGKVQAMIRKIFLEGVSNIKLKGTQVIPVPLFQVLDGKNSDDYIARVEPSSQGGKKMAGYFLDILENPELAFLKPTNPIATVASTDYQSMSAPETSSISRNL